MRILLLIILFLLTFLLQQECWAFVKTPYPQPISHFSNLLNNDDLLQEEEGSSTSQSNQLKRKLIDKIEALENEQEINQVIWAEYNRLTKVNGIITTERVFNELLENPPSNFNTRLIKEVYLILANLAAKKNTDNKYDIARGLILKAGEVDATASICDKLELRLEIAALYARADPPNYEAAKLSLEQLLTEAARNNCNDLKLTVQIYFAERIYEYQGQLVKSLLMKRRAIAFADSVDLKPLSKALAHIQMANLHYDMHNYEPALLHFRTADQYFREANVRDRRLISNINNIALCFRELGEHEQALQGFNEALNLAIELNDVAWKGILKGNIGDIYYREKEYQKAIPLLKEDIEIASKKGSRLSHMLSLNRLGMSYIKTSKVIEGKSLLDSATRVFEQQRGFFERVGFPEKRLSVELENLEGNIAYYKALQVFDTAFILSEKYNQLKDSLNIIRQRQSLAWTETQLIIEETNEENSILKEEVEQQNYLLYTGLAVILMLLIVIASIWKTYSSSVKTKKEMKKRETAEYRVVEEREKRKSIEEETQQKLDLLEKVRLQEELAYKQRELVSHTHLLVEKNTVLQEVINKIEKNTDQHNTSVLIEEVLSILKSGLDKEFDWENYKKVFEKVHPQFFVKLIEKYPKLTQNDLRYAAYVKMGLSSKEIATILNVNSDSLKNTRYRMRQKMKLTSETKINDFIVGFQS